MKSRVIGMTLDMETGNYYPVTYEDLNLHATIEVKKAPKKKVLSKKVPKEKIITIKDMKKRVPRVKIAGEKTVKADRHTEITKVLATFDGKPFKRSEYMTASVAVLGKEIPFNKIVREVYCKKVSGAYVAVTV